MPLTETTMMALHKEARHCSWQNRAIFRDGMAYGSLIAFEKVRRLIRLLSTTVAELDSFMNCFDSCLFLPGLWMEISSEVANLHMRIDAKKLVTTARTIHLLEHRETIHMISMMRKEDCYRKYS